jgi:tetratricopeptide (TPR) repeat protein
MKKLLLSFLVLSCVPLLYAQKLHTPAEILKIMTDSKVMFELTMLDSVIKTPDYSKSLNYNEHYRVIKGSEIHTFEYKYSSKVQSLSDQAEEAFQKKDMDKALECYLSMLKEDSTLAKIITYVGQIYENRGDHETAIKWYQKAIAVNYIDYMAHWFMADSYFKLNKLDKALEEITLAKILNRNNLRLHDSFTRILKANDRVTDDWYFTPQIVLEKKENGRIYLAVNKDWMGYGMAKALWKYDPDFQKKMGVAQGTYTMQEDRESLSVLLMAQENSKTDISNDRQFVVLKSATFGHNIDQYILFELLLPKHPSIVYQLPEDVIVGIKDYILKYRHPVKQSGAGPAA